MQAIMLKEGRIVVNMPPVSSLRLALMMELQWYVAACYDLHVCE